MQKVFATRENGNFLTQEGFDVISYDKHEAIRLMRLDGFSRRGCAKILGLNRHTVGTNWDIESDTVPPVTRKRAKWFEGHEALIKTLFMYHGNCDEAWRELLG